MEVIINLFVVTQCGCNGLLSLRSNLSMFILIFCDWERGRHIIIYQQNIVENVYIHSK